MDRIGVRPGSIARGGPRRRWFPTSPLAGGRADLRGNWAPRRARPIQERDRRGPAARRSGRGRSTAILERACAVLLSEASSVGDGDAMKVLDVTDFYSDRGGGIRSHLDAKGRALAALGVDHVTLAPGARDGDEALTAAGSRPAAREIGRAHV